jgi:hypothetical protein
VVVDVGSSMGRVAPGNSRTNWDLTRDLLVRLSSAWWGAVAGVSFYPNQATTPNLGNALPPTACISTAADVPLPATWNLNDTSRVSAIQDALWRVQVDPYGGAPTHDAYRMAVDSLTQYHAAQPSIRGGLVLVTDGHPTFERGCVGTGHDPVDPEPIVGEIAAAYAAGIWTVVVGAPGSASDPVTGRDARPWLSRAARAGGKRKLVCSDQGPVFCHVDMTQDPDLATAAGQIPACEVCQFSLEWVPAGMTLDLAQLRLVYQDPQGTYLVRESVEEPCQRGWHYLENQTVLEICPETCDVLGQLPGGIHYEVGCVSDPQSL